MMCDRRCSAWTHAQRRHTFVPARLLSAATMLAVLIGAGSAAAGSDALLRDGLTSNQTPAVRAAAPAVPPTEAASDRSDEPADEAAGDAPADPPAEAPPDLDDLLGIDGDGAAESGGDRIAEQEAAEELRRRLAAESLGDAFQQAIRLMTLVVARFDDALDTGIETQRAQDDVIARLESLIEEARRQQSQQSSSSSSSSSQQQQQQQQQPESQSSSSSSAQSQADAQANEGDGDEEGTLPPGQQADFGSAMEETRAEWGALPERIRNMLLQGRRERFSSLYEQLTREYYRRLAEE